MKTLTFEKKGELFVPFEMENGNAPAATPTPANGGGSVMPPGSENKEAESILKQADMLKEQLNAKDKATQEQQMALQKEREARAEMEKELAFYRKKAQAEAEKYAKEQEPKVAEYIAGLEEQTGKKFDEEKKKRIYNAFTDPRLKDDADDMWKAHQHTVSVTAAKKSLEEQRENEKKQYEQEKIKLTETLSKAAHSMGSMRATYAQALTPQVSELPKVENDSYRKTVDVTAGLHLSDLMEVPRATKLDQTVLKAYGYSNEVLVNAAAVDEEGNAYRPLRTHIRKAPEHSQLIDPETKDYNMGGSLRYTSPIYYSWLTNESGLMDRDMDMSNLTNVKSFTLEEKRVDA